MAIKEMHFNGIFYILMILLMCASCESREERMKNWGSQGNIQKLEKSLTHKDINIRLYAISLMAQTGHTNALRPLIGCLQNENFRVRAYAAQELGYLGSCGVVDKQTVSQLASILDDPNYVSRHDIIAALGRSGLPSAIPPLVEMLHNKDDTIRKSSVEALECLIRERKYPCSQIGALEISSISNALDSVKSDKN